MTEKYVPNKRIRQNLGKITGKEMEINKDQSNGMKMFTELGKRIGEQSENFKK